VFFEDLSGEVLRMILRARMLTLSEVVVDTSPPGFLTHEALSNGLARVTAANTARR